MRKICLILVMILNLFALDTYAISAKSAVLIDAKSGRVLFSHNAEARLPMASTTKIMTGLLACESEKLNDIVTVSPLASGTEGSSLWLKVGEKLSLCDLVYGLMLKSGNDAAVSIAEHIGGSVESFALLMNQRAKEAGAVNTNFENPHGLDSDEHYTTAHDLALISREAMKNETFSKIVATKNYSIPMQGESWDRALKNHNKMLWRYDGCDGVKTGFTKKCGRCLVTSAKRNDAHLICVTLNAPDDWNDHEKILNYGFENFITRNVAKKGDVITSLLYDKENNRRVNLVLKEDFSVLCRKDEEILSAIEYKDVKIPAEKGSTGGYLYAFADGKESGKAELVLEKDIEEMTLLQKLRLKLSGLFYKSR